MTDATWHGDQSPPTGAEYESDEADRHPLPGPRRLRAPDPDEIPHGFERDARSPEHCLRCGGWETDRVHRDGSRPRPIRPLAPFICPSPGCRYEFMADDDTLACVRCGAPLWPNPHPSTKRPDPDSIRAALAGDYSVSAVGAAAVGLPGLGALLHAKAEEEGAAQCLAAICRPSRLPDLIEEAKRRAEVMQRWYDEQDRSGPAGETPLLGGLRSVYDDVVRGWLG